jgi:Rhs element Vgr protein
MPDTPYIPEYNIVEVEILINGNNDGLHTLLKKLHVNYELNKIPTAKLFFISSNPQIDQEDNALQSDNLQLSDDIEVKIFTGEDTETLFKGIVYRIEKSAEGTDGFVTKIECKDVAVKLTGQQEINADETFAEKMDRFLNDIQMINEVQLDAFGEETISKIQQISPWDYLLSFLDSLGLMTRIRESSFNTVNITVDPEESQYLAQNGANVQEFQLKKEECIADVEVRYWNPESQSIESQERSSGAHHASGKEVLDMSQSSYKADTIAQIAKARASKHRLSSIKGKVKTFGNLKAKCGDYIEFKNINSQIDGDAFLISSEYHHIENGNWETEYSFGLENAKSFAENINTSIPSNASLTGQTNSMQGLQIGVVTQLEDDPENEFRVKVKIPSISDDAEGIWARLSSFQAGNDRGAFFIPEVGDEIILGCINNNPDTPVILGKLFSSANAMPYPIEVDNKIQGIVSKEQTKIIINDEDKSVEISTQNGNKLLISDTEKGLVLEDENSNKITMNTDGITLDSTRDINLNGQGSINIEGQMINIKAGGIVELSGSLIKLN